MGMIEVIQVEFYDGTKYIARRDKPNCNEEIGKVVLEKSEALNAISLKERRKIADKSFRDIGGLQRRTLKTIDEDLYNKIKMKG